jgi:hypothetical protein
MWVRLEFQVMHVAGELKLNRMILTSVWMYECGKIWIRACAHLVVFSRWIIVMNRFAMWGNRGHALLSSKSMSDVCKEAFTYTCPIEAWILGVKNFMDELYF